MALIPGEDYEELPNGTVNITNLSALDALLKEQIKKDEEADARFWAEWAQLEKFADEHPDGEV